MNVIPRGSGNLGSAESRGPVIQDLIRNPEGRRPDPSFPAEAGIHADMTVGFPIVLFVLFTLTFDSSPIKGEGMMLAHH